MKKLFALILLLPTFSYGSMTPLSEQAEQCIIGASTYHKVNPYILKAIVRHESRGRPKTIALNTNGSIDVGLTGINSIHFAELQRKGVAPVYLLDACVSIWVGAWTYSKKVHKYGNTWRAVGAYHSETDRYNQRYQSLIYNEIVNMGVLGVMGRSTRAGQKQKPHDVNRAA